MPTRTCTGCHETAEKAQLLRVVGTARGVVLDERQRLPGRGAYVHGREKCLERAVKRGGLARTLRRQVPMELFTEGTAAGRIAGPSEPNSSTSSSTSSSNSNDNGPGKENGNP